MEGNWSQPDSVAPALSGPSSSGEKSSPKPTPQEILFQKCQSLFLQDIDTVILGYPGSGYKNTPTGPKKNRIYRTEHRKPTLKDSNNHFAGRVVMVTRPIRRDNTCVTGTIDVDQYNLDLPDLQRRSGELCIPLIWVYSKSKGGHGWAFFSKPVAACLARRLLKKWAVMLNLEGSEIFPKSDTLPDPNACGHGIALPFFGDGLGFAKFQPTFYSVPPHEWDLPEERTTSIEYSDDPGYWDVRALEVMLETFKEQIPTFAYRPCRGKFAVICPGQTEIGWSDGARHSTKKLRHQLDHEALLWIENGWLAFRCVHAHCDGGCGSEKKTASDWLDFWDPLRRRFNFDQWQAAETALADEKFLTEYGGASCPR